MTPWLMSKFQRDGVDEWIERSVNSIREDDEPGELMEL
jgi:hypothetical protein